MLEGAFLMGLEKIAEVAELTKISDILPDFMKDISNNESSDLGDEISEKQKISIKEAFNRIANGEKLTDSEKGNLGEMLMDQYYISQGYKPIHKPRVTDLEHKSGQGIDGVYEKIDSNGEKKYIIADAKTNKSILNKGLADGTNQMSNAWIDKRLDDAVGKEKADEIRDAYEDNPESVLKEVYNFRYNIDADQSITGYISSVDENGNQNNDKTLVQVFDRNGNVTENRLKENKNDEG